MARTSPPAGYTLIELLTVMVLLAVLTSIAVPSLNGTLRSMRVRAALDRLTSDLYQARAMAARSGREVLIRFDPAGGTCAARYLLEDPTLNLWIREVDLEREAPGVCLVVSGPSVIRINARGMPVGAARKVRASSGRTGDSLTISLVGRVYRWGERKR